MNLVSLIPVIGPLLDPLGSVAKDLASAYAAAKDAETEQDKVEAGILIKQLELRQELLVKEQGDRLTKWIRPAFAYPLAFYLAKIWVWDKALGLGASDPVDENLLWVMTTIVGFYFLMRPIEKVIGRK